MKKLKGKCKTCLGCNLLDDFGFKGRKRCKYYQKTYDENFDKYIVIAFIIFTLFLITTIISVGYWIYRFNMLCGG